MERTSNGICGWVRFVFGTGSSRLLHFLLQAFNGAQAGSWIWLNKSESFKTFLFSRPFFTLSPSQSLPYPILVTLIVVISRSIGWISSSVSFITFMAKQIEQLPKMGLVVVVYPGVYQSFMLLTQFKASSATPIKASTIFPHCSTLLQFPLLLQNGKNQEKNLWRQAQRNAAFDRVWFIDENVESHFRYALVLTFSLAICALSCSHFDFNYLSFSPLVFHLYFFILFDKNWNSRTSSKLFWDIFQEKTKQFWL